MFVGAIKRNATEKRQNHFTMEKISTVKFKYASIGIKTKMSIVDEAMNMTVFTFVNNSLKMLRGEGKLEVAVV